MSAIIQRPTVRQICLAANNKRKIASIKALLEPHRIQVTETAIGEKPEEKGEFPCENAARRAEYAHRKMKIPGIGVDTGLSIYSLKGFPGAQGKFLKAKGLRRTFELLKEKPRKCELRIILVYTDGNELYMRYESRGVQGVLAETPKGRYHQCDWNELWRYFIPDGTTKTVGEYTPEEFETWRREMYREMCIQTFIDHYPERPFIKAAE